MSNLRQQGLDVTSFMHKEIGNGEETMFWDDLWQGEQRFREKYHRLYTLENCKGITVASKLSLITFDYSFRRKPRGGVEEYQFLEIVKELKDVTLSNKNDRWNWQLEDSGEFTVASLRAIIDDWKLPKMLNKTRWVRMVPNKVNVLAWKISLDGLPTRLNISKRGMEIETIMCPICDIRVESVNHLFFDCQLARVNFNKITRWWNLQSVIISSYENWLEWLHSVRLKKKTKEMLEGVCYVMWWYLWNWRNKRIFEPLISSKELIFDEIVLKAFLWCRNRGNRSFSWLDWIKNPYLISL